MTTDAKRAPGGGEWRRPPNQNIVRRKESWPVVGETVDDVRAAHEDWTLAIDGAVAAAETWTLDALRVLPQAERTVDIHCVTRWSKLDCVFRGVRLVDLIEAARPSADAVSARFVARTGRAHDTTLTLADIQRCEPLVALEYDGEPLPLEHGGPIRIVTPGKYFYKSCKWLERVEILDEHRLGYWESGPGYHDGADPWREERYVTGSIPPELRERMIALKRFGGRDLLSCVFDGEDLSSLDAEAATLRNTSFVGANLRGANFRKSVLVNACMRRANLAGASFRDADMKGADFREADLSGADFAGAEMFGVNFCADGGGEGARFDGAPLLSEAQIDALSEPQAEYVRAALAAARKD